MTIAFGHLGLRRDKQWYCMQYKRLLGEVHLQESSRLRFSRILEGSKARFSWGNALER
jgi:hypothetical protein